MAASPPTRPPLTVEQARLSLGLSAVEGGPPPPRPALVRAPPKVEQNLYSPTGQTIENTGGESPMLQFALDEAKATPGPDSRRRLVDVAVATNMSDAALVDDLANAGIASTVGPLIQAGDDFAHFVGRALPEEWSRTVARGVDYSLTGLLPFLQVPQQLMNQGAAELGDLLLPEEGPVADTIKAGMRKAAPYLTPGAGTHGATGTAAMKIDDAVREASGIPKGVSIPDDEEHAKTLGEVSDRFYQMIASGGLAKRADQHRMDQDLFGWHPTALNGYDILDAAITREQAARLATTADNPADKSFYQALTTNTGRAALGMAWDVVVDPLWFFGPAEGAKLVATGNKLYHASGSLIGDVASISRHLGQSELELVSRVAGVAAGGAAVDLTADIAKARAAADMARQVATTAGDAKQAQALARDLMSIDRIAGDVAAGDLGRRVTESGLGKFHVPFSESTKVALPGVSLEGALSAVDSYLLGGAVGKAQGNWRALERKADLIAAEKLPSNAMSSAEEWKLMMTRGVVGAADLPLFVYDLIGRSFGTRSFQALYLTNSKATKLAERAGRPIGRNAAWGLARKVVASNAEDWQKATSYLSEAAMALTQKQQQVTGDIYRMQKMAEEVIENRKKAGTFRGETVSSILLDAADARERGSGGLEAWLTKRPEMRPVLAATDQLLATIAQAAGVPLAHAKQVLHNMARKVEGSPEQYRHYVLAVRTALAQNPAANRIYQGLAPSWAGGSMWKEPRQAIDDLRAAMAQHPDPRVGQALRDLEDSLDKGSIPRMPGDGSAIPSRVVHEWESDLWAGFGAILQQHAPNASQEDIIRAALAPLRNEAKLPSQVAAAAPGLAVADNHLPSILGERYGGLSPDLQPVVDKLSTILDRYEDFYKEAGFSFVADPLRRLKDWGVEGYVPHMKTEKTALARGWLLGEAGGVHGGAAPAVGSLDARLSTMIDARRMRGIEGTLAEVNDAGASTIRYSMDPIAMLARLSASNRALTGKEFIVAMMRGGVLKKLRTVEGALVDDAGRAVEGDFVPLLNAHERTRAWDLLRDAKAGVAGNALTPQEIDDALARLRSSTVGSGDPLAAWASDAPQIRQGANIERALVEVNGKRYLARAPLLDVKAEVQAKASALLAALRAKDPSITALNRTQKAGIWDEVAEALQREQVGYSPLLPESTISEAISGEYLRHFYQDEPWKFYMPADVYQNTVDALDMAAQMPDRLSKLGRAKAVNDYLNNFVKTRYTIINTAFHAANGIYNNFTNIFSHGVKALNPKKQMLAGQLTAAAHFVQKYGSLEEAAAHFARQAPPARLATAAGGAVKGAAAGHLVAPGVGTAIGAAAGAAVASAGFEADWFATTCAHLIGKNIDLGDGFARPINNILREMEKTGVLSGAYTGMEDLARMQDDIASLYTTDLPTQLWKKVTEEGWDLPGTGGRVKVPGLSRIEDALLVPGAVLIGGPLAVGTAMSKETGSLVASSIENQTRIVNFLCEMETTRSWTHAAASVRRYLFNYDDLSTFQKVWMRSLMLFYSWNVKNLVLQSQLLFERPALFNKFNQLFLTDGPALVDAYNAEMAQKEYYPLVKYTREQNATIEPAERNKARSAIPGHTQTFVTGFKSPIEAAADLANDLRMVLNGDMRIMAKTSYLVKTVAEIANHHNYFYGEDYDKLNSGRQVGNVLSQIELMKGDIGTETPEGRYFNYVLSYFQSALVETTGWHGALVRDSTKGALAERSWISAGAAQAWNSLPWRPWMSRAGAMSEANAWSLVDDSAADGPSASETVGVGARVADAYLGLAITQIDEAQRRRRHEQKLTTEALDMLTAHGIYVDRESHGVRANAPKASISHNKLRTVKLREVKPRDL